MAGGIGAYGGDYSGINQVVADRNANWRTVQQLIEQQTARRQSARQAEMALQLQREMGMANLGLDRERLGLERDRMGQSAGQFDRSLGLQERELGQRGTQFDASLELQKRLGLGSQDIQREGLGEQRRQFDTTSDFQRERAGVADTQFERQLGQRQTEFGGEMGLRERQLQQGAEQFGASLGEQRAGREQQGSLSLAEMALRERLGNKGAADAMAQLERRFQLEGAQQEKQFGMQQEAYKQKATDERAAIERQFALKSLLERNGITTDEARTMLGMKPLPKGGAAGAGAATTPLPDVLDVAAAAEQADGEIAQDVTSMVGELQKLIDRESKGQLGEDGQKRKDAIQEFIVAAKPFLGQDYYSMPFWNSRQPQGKRILPFWFDQPDEEGGNRLEKAGDALAELGYKVQMG